MSLRVEWSCRGVQLGFCGSLWGYVRDYVWGCAGGYVGDYVWDLWGYLGVCEDMWGLCGCSVGLCGVMWVVMFGVMWGVVWGCVYH